MSTNNQGLTVQQGRQRLWVVSELYYPEETSTGYYLTRIAEGLTDSFDVSVICGQPNYSRRGTRAPRRETRKNVNIFRAFGTTFNKNVIALRVINIITLSFSVFSRALLGFRSGDRILVVTNPPSMPFIVAAASLIRGAAYTLLIHDTYPEILIAAGKTRPNSAVTKTFDLLNRWLYKYAAKAIVVGRDMRELAANKTEGLDVPIATIPNWAELESVRPTPRSQNPILGELGLHDKFVFLYAGNMGYPNDLESIVACAEAIRGHRCIRFVFLGAGAKRSWLEREVQSKHLKNVIILDPKPRSEQKDFLNACDVAIVSLVSRMWGVSVPSRTYNVLAAGKPILAIVEENSEVARVVKENDIGWIVSPGDHRELLARVLEAFADEDLAAKGGRARGAAVANYSANQAIARYKQELGGIPSEATR